MLANILYKNSRYFFLFMVVILAVGIASFNSIAKQEDPTITNFVASVTTLFPGATPARVEALVTRPLEDRLRKISEIDEISSTSNTNVSFLNIKLKETLSEQAIEQSWSEIRDALRQAESQFPEGVLSPVFDDDRLSSYTTILSISAKEDTHAPLSLVHRIAQDFADQARNVPGTRLVDLYGEPEEEIRLDVDESAMMARGLSLQQIAGALKGADPRISAGRASGTGADLLIEVAGEFDSMARIRDVIVGTTPAGGSTRIGDIARVYKTQASPPASLVLTQGKPGILIGVTMEDGLQVGQWSQIFTAFVEDFRESAPAGLVIETSYDQSSYTAARLLSVSQNLAAGILIVILVLLVTMGWRAAVVVAIILPLCGLMSLTVLDIMGMAIHQMSVTGLIVALGLLVDGSIVMTDEVRKRLYRGESPAGAISGSVGRLRIPLLASAVTTILAFMPMAILPGPSGDFMGTIAISVVVMLSASLLLALIFTPVLAAWILPKGLEAEQHWWITGIDSGRMGKTLTRAVDWSLRHQPAAIALALALPIAGFLSFPTLTAQFFPGTDRDQMYIQVKLPDGRSIYDTYALVEKLDAQLRQEPLIRHVDWTVGESAPAFYYNMYRFKEGVASFAEALILTTDENLTDDLIRRLQLEVDQQYPEARIIVRGIDQGPPVFAPLEIELYGPNLDTLQALGEQFRGRLENIADVTHTAVSLAGGAPKLVFNLNEDKLRLANLHLTDAAETLDASLRGRLAGEVLEGTERLPVRVRLSAPEWANANQIANLRIPSPQGQQTTNGELSGIALSTLGKAELVPSRSPISRFNGERVNTVQAYLTRGVLPEEALKALRADLATNPIALPQGYRFKFGGDSDVRATVVDQIMAPLGLIVSALLATIVLTFNSWRLSAIAFLVCFCSLGLSLLSLEIFGYPFGVQALIGVIGSIGVSINAAIIIMTALQLNEAAMRGSLFAIREVVMDSSRHIVSTTLTTFGGFLPLILEGSQFWPPFAMAIAGGVLLSTIVSFFLVPPLFALVNRQTQLAIESTVNLNLKQPRIDSFAG
ncbi:MAG: efflux RND transporter permease subunit [Halioglobus sp.]